MNVGLLSVHRLRFVVFLTRQARTLTVLLFFQAGDAFSPKIVRRPPPVVVNGQIHPQRPQVPLQQQDRPSTTMAKCDSVVAGSITAATLAGQVAAMSLGVGKELNGGIEQQQQSSYTTAVSGAEELASPSAVVVAPSQSM
jgi:hypothetical protein